MLNLRSGSSATTSGSIRSRPSCPRRWRWPPPCTVAWQNPLRKWGATPKRSIPFGRGIRRLHKAFLRYHDPDNWPILREALERMGRRELIGNSPDHLVPRFQPGVVTAQAAPGRNKLKRLGQRSAISAGSPEPAAHRRVLQIRQAGQGRPGGYACFEIAGR